VRKGKREILREQEWLYPRLKHSNTVTESLLTTVFGSEMPFPLTVVDEQDDTRTLAGASALTLLV